MIKFLLENVLILRLKKKLCVCVRQVYPVTAVWKVPSVRPPTDHRQTSASPASAMADPWRVTRTLASAPTVSSEPWEICAGTARRTSWSQTVINVSQTTMDLGLTSLMEHAQVKTDVRDKQVSGMETGGTTLIPIPIFHTLFPRMWIGLVILLGRLQRIQNSAARLVTRTRSHESISPILLYIHCIGCQLKIG